MAHRGGKADSGELGLAEDDNGVTQGAHLVDGGLSIGPRLRRLRRQKNLSLDVVASATGLTKSFISQMERGQTAPSLASLVKICDALDADVAWLFERQATTLIREEDRRQVDFGGHSVRDFLLTPSSNRLQVTQTHVDPGGGSGDERYSLVGDAEFLLVLEGQLEAHVGSESHTLQAGDSLTFSPRSPQAWRNPSTDSGAVVLWVVTPPPW